MCIKLGEPNIDELMSSIQAELVPGESILWSGQPRQGFMLREIDLVLIPVSLLMGWGSFQLMTLLIMGEIHQIHIVVVIFWVLTLYMLFFRFFVDMEIRRRTCYAITNRRIIILKDMFNQRITSVELTGLTEIYFRIYWHGWGTINFGESPSLLYPWLNFVSPKYAQNPYGAPKFDTVADAEKLCRLISHLTNDTVKLIDQVG